MIRLVFYLFPAFVNCICGGMFFFTSVSFTEAGQSGFVVGATTATWSITYAVGSILFGKLLTEKNAAFMISAGTFLMALACSAFLLFSGIWLIFGWIFLAGLGGSAYCTAYQVFMKTLEPANASGGGIVNPTAFYTASWSFGMGAGPFLNAFLGKTTGFILFTVLALIISSGILVIWKFAPVIRKKQEEKAMNKPVKKGDETDYSKYPNCAMTGWIVGGCGTFAVWAIRALEPYRAIHLEISKQDAAYALALLSIMQGFTALCLVCSKRWMYSPRRAVLAASFGIAGLLLFAFGTNAAMFYLAAFFYGLFSGCTYFYFVFYSLANPDSRKYLAVNEAIVGAVGVLAPVLGGFLIRFGGPLPFMLCALLIAAAACYHFLALKKVGSGKENA